jgi:TolB protein
VDTVDREELEALVEALIEEARRRARRRRRIYASVIGLVALVGVAAFEVFGRVALSQTSPATPAPQALAAAGAESHRIAYSRSAREFRWGGPITLWVVSPDGSGRRQLTPRTGFASWSPDGRRIAFGEGDDIYVMNADGGRERRLTRSRAGESSGSPAWSPDGRKILFIGVRDGNVDVFVVNADGTGQRRLTDSPGDDVGASWSPDGRRIVFLTARHGDPETPLTAAFDTSLEVHVMDADGSGQLRLTDSAATVLTASWSPDGRRIVFVSAGPGCWTSCHRLFVINADGGGQRRLTSGNDHAPSWAPDGRRIAFVRGWPESHVYVVNADGSGLRRIPRARSIPEAPVWSPDGRMIAFAGRSGVRPEGCPSCYPPDMEIYVVNADGTGLRNLTRSPGDDVAPVWVPR